MAFNNTFSSKWNCRCPSHYELCLQIEPCRIVCVGLFVSKDCLHSSGAHTCAASSLSPALFHDCKQVFCLSVTREWYVVALPCLILRIVMVAVYTCMQLHIHTCMQVYKWMYTAHGCTLASGHAFDTIIKPVMHVSLLTCSAQKSLESVNSSFLSLLLVQCQ